MSLAPLATAQTDAAVAVYRAYGLCIHSEVLLPELSADLSGAPADLWIRRRPLPPGPARQFGEHRIDLRWEAVGAFRIEPALITVDPHSGVGDDLLAFPLLGPVLALALHQRGTFALHASAVAVNGLGVVMMADKGVGKSTTATALLNADHRLLADDIVAFDEAGLRLLPGFAQVKLSDASLARLAVAGAQARPTVHDAIDKHRVLLPQVLAPHPVPLARLYALERGAPGSAPQVIGVGPADALPLVLRFAYAARFGREALSGAAAARHFRQAVAIAGSGAVRRLVLPDALDRLAEAVALIETDAKDAE